MGRTKWDELTKLEQDLMIVAAEASGILPYGHRAEDEEAAAAVLAMVDRGWVTVHRLDPYGERGFAVSDPLPREGLEQLLADPDVWDDPEHPHWVGELTLAMAVPWSAFH